MKKFEVGKTYFVRSICDYDCIWHIIIVGISKTGKSVSFKIKGESYINRCKIHKYKDTEYIMPFGRFSMSPSLRAEDIIKESNDD